MSTLIRKVGDTARIWTGTLKFNNTAIDLSGSTVIMKIKSIADGSVVERNVDILVAASGSIIYQPVAADVATVGKYQIEFYISGSAGGETTPTDGYHLLYVNPTLS